MLPAIWDQIEVVLGYNRDVGDVNALQMALRTVLIYAVSLVLIRFGSKRFLSQASAFDVIVGIMLGSVMSRAINSSAPLVPTVAAGAVLVGLHWFVCAACLSDQLVRFHRQRQPGSVDQGRPGAAPGRAACRRVVSRPGTGAADARPANGSVQGRTGVPGAQRRYQHYSLSV